MEMVTALGSMIGVGAAGAGAAAGGSLFKTILQGTLTAFSAASSIGQGINARRDAEIEQAGIAAQASRDKIAADDEAVRINRALAEAIGEQSIAFAAAGISLASGTPVQARQEARRSANEDLNINRSNLAARTSAWNQRKWAAAARGENAFGAGIVNAIGDIGGFALDVANRGGPSPFGAKIKGDPWAGMRGV